MATVYYPAFHVLRVDAAGDRVVLASETVDVDNITAASSLGTLTSDADGIIAEGSFSATVGDVIEISHATYPLTCRFTLTATQDEAYTLADNDVVGYVAENLHTDTTESISAALFLTDTDNDAIQPIRLGDGKLDHTNEYLLLGGAVEKHFRLTLFPLDENLSTTGADFSTAEFFDFTVPASVQPLDATLTALAGLTITQGSLIYGTGADAFAILAKDTNATRYLSNQGTSNNPSWNQVNLANGVTGDLPFANLTQGSALSVLGVTGNATADNASIAAASDHQVMRRSGTAVAFGAVNLAQSAAVTGVLPLANGGHTSQELTRTVPTTVNDYVEIGNIVPSIGASVLRISVVVEGSGISLGQTYLISTRWASTANTWQNVVPYTESNFASATASVSVDINGNNDTTSFRLRRTAGTTACTAKVRVEVLGDTTISFTGTTGTGSMSAPTVAYGKVVYSGTYTPTLGGTWSSNLSSTTAYQCQYSRIDNVVTVSGKVTLDVVTTATDTYIGISLPIATSSAIGEEYLAGTAFTDAVAGQGARIYLLNGDALLRFVSNDTASRGWSFHFTYQIV